MQKMDCPFLCVPFGIKWGIRASKEEPIRFILANSSSTRILANTTATAKAPNKRQARQCKIHMKNLLVSSIDNISPLFIRLTLLEVIFGVSFNPCNKFLLLKYYIFYAIPRKTKSGSWSLRKNGEDPKRWSVLPGAFGKKSGEIRCQSRKMAIQRMREKRINSSEVKYMHWVPNVSRISNGFSNESISIKI